MTVRSINAPTLARLLGGLPEGRPFYAALARTLRGLVRRSVLIEALRRDCPDWEFGVPPGGLAAARQALACRDADAAQVTRRVYV